MKRGPHWKWGNSNGNLFSSLEGRREGAPDLTDVKNFKVIEKGLFKQQPPPPPKYFIKILKKYNYTLDIENLPQLL